MNITFRDFFSLPSKGVLIDIRDKESYLQGHVPGAQNIISSELLYHANSYLNYKDIYYLYCDVGYISADVCKRLRMQGYHVFSIIGGYQNYLLRD